MPLSDAESTRYSNWSLIRRLLALGWQYRAGCLKVLGYQVVLLAMGMSGLGLTGLGIDFIRHEVQPTSKPPHWPFGWMPPSDWGPMMVLAVIGGIIFVLALFRSGLNYLYTIAIAQLVQMEIVTDLRARVYDKLQRLSFRFFDANASGTIINRVTADVQSLRLFVDGVLIQSVIMLLSLAVYTAYMLSIHVRLTLACLATMPFLWVASAWFSRVVRPAYVQNRDLFDGMVLTLSESIQGIQVVKGFAREREEIARFHAANRAVRDQQQWIFWRVSTFTPFIGLLSQISIAVLLCYGGFLVIHDELPLGAGMVVFAGLLQQFSGQISNIATLANSIQQSLTGARRVFEILDAPLEVQSQPEATRLPKARGDVRFERVWFEFKPGDPALQDVSFEVPPGRCMAVLGATGSGKSALLSLIPRFYDPVRGRVLIDGQDARDLDLDDLRRNIGIVFQESFLFSNTVAANIAFGHPDATREQIERAAKIAAAHEFILKLPEGYDTILGEGGSDLSGGQRQRLAIARAVLLEPPVLILDDPTAAIDPQTEHEILEAMDNAMEGRTTFVVAHRLSTLRRADMVIVLDNGRVAQMGTHEQLMRMKGQYQVAAKLQEADEESKRLLGEGPA